MNNIQMYNMSAAGGVDYPETEKYDFIPWYPTTGMTDGGAYKNLRFNVRQDNLLIHWRNSYLVLKGQLVKKATGEAYEPTDYIALIHNCVPHMFDNLKLCLGSEIVETVDHPGHVSSLMYDILYGRSKSKCEGLMFMWVPDTVGGVAGTDPHVNKGFGIRHGYLMLCADSRGSFNFQIPLHMMFGFMENFVAIKQYPVDKRFRRCSNLQTRCWTGYSRTR